MFGMRAHQTTGAGERQLKGKVLPGGPGSLVEEEGRSEAWDEA